MEGFYIGRAHGFSNYTMIGSHPGADVTEESIVSLVTVLGSSISLVGLVFAFITYSLFSDLRNLSGTALMNFLAALFMSQLLYVVGVGGVQDAELCVGLAFSLQYMRLTVFCWMFLMSHHMHWYIGNHLTIFLDTRNRNSSAYNRWYLLDPFICIFSTFRDNMHLLPPVNTGIRSIFWRYSLFGWCFPGIFLGVSVFVQSKKTGNLLNVKNLQSTNCWFVDRDAFLCGYVLPVLLLLILIVASLVRTAFVIRQSVSIQVNRRTRDKMRRKRRLQLFLHLKLTAFLSTVYLLAVIYMLTKMHTFWILFNVFQGIQGILVALCVTCNCQILKIYTRSLKKHRKHSQYGCVNNDLSKSTSLQMLTWDPAPDTV